MCSDFFSIYIGVGCYPIECYLYRGDCIWFTLWNNEIEINPLVYVV